jgi:hypothetical protein
VICIIKSWRCDTCEREIFFDNQPRKLHYHQGEKCKGNWICYEWRRQTKPITFNEGVAVE